ncbi:Sorting nexin mvp-1 [Verticillium dahliae VDG1]|nr:Sorting nexin mvp-1 [Verticillium dahliae VDG1]
MARQCPSLYDALPFLPSLARYTEIIIEVDTDGGLE